MNAENDKVYKLYKNKECGTLYIAQGGYIIYYKSLIWFNKWYPVKPLYNNCLHPVSKYIGNIDFIRDMSEEELFLELL